MQIGRLRPVRLRELWKGEATHFTPWLAEDENIALLGETLGLRLEVEAVEKQIGSFIADIVARDAERNSVVLIENQLAPTDHRHLGQILTYAAGIDAQTIIWISESVREEHRAAIDWLNEISGTHFRFFAIEVQAWTIDGISAAPQFQVISKPNDWSKRAFSASETQAETLDENQRRWRTYWEGLIARAAGRYEALANRTPGKGNWQNAESRHFGVPFYVNYVASNSQNGLRAEFYIGGDYAKKLFRVLEARKAELEMRFGAALSWEELPSAKASRIAVYMAGAYADRETYPVEQYDWIISNLLKLKSTFDPALDEIDAAALCADTEEGGEEL